MFLVLLAFIVWLFATGKYADWIALAQSGYATPNGGKFDGHGASGDW